MENPLDDSHTCVLLLWGDAGNVTKKTRFTLDQIVPGKLLRSFSPTSAAELAAEIQLRLPALVMLPEDPGGTRLPDTPAGKEYMERLKLVIASDITKLVRVLGWGIDREAEGSQMGLQLGELKSLDYPGPDLPVNCLEFRWHAPLAG